MINATNVGQNARAFISYQEEVHGIDPAYWAEHGADLEVLSMWAEGASDYELGLLAISVREESRPLHI